MDHLTKAARTKIMSVAHFSDRLGSSNSPDPRPVQDYGFYGGQDEEQAPPTSLDAYGCERTILNHHKKHKNSKQPLTRPSARPQQPATYPPSPHSQNSVNTQNQTQFNQHSNSMQASSPNANPQYVAPPTPANQQPQAPSGYSNSSYNGAQGQAAQYYGSNQPLSPPTPDPYGTPNTNQQGYSPPPQYPPPQSGQQPNTVHQPMGICIHRYYIFTHRTECPHYCVLPAYS